MAVSERALIILFGAFDRYNYGDNLMPLLLHKFLAKFYPEHLECYEVVYASITKSDLTSYGCAATVPIGSLMDAPAGSWVIVVGGEVLCAKSADLFLHVQPNNAAVIVWKMIRRISKSFYRSVAMRLYSTPWEYPYIPDRHCFKHPVHIALNSVGGSISPTFGAGELTEVIGRLQAAEYFSVRDHRFGQSTDKLSPLVVPDSAMTMSQLVSSEELDPEFERLALPFKPGKYIVLQAAPHKNSENPNAFAKALSQVCRERGLGVVLLAIGHASGHDDLRSARRFSKRMECPAVIVSEQSVLQTMAIIARSHSYIGTSLHGAITALSFCVPHFALGDRVPKLTSYLSDWSVGLFTEPVRSATVASIYRRDWRPDIEALRRCADNGVKLAVEANHELVKSLKRAVA